MAACQFVVTNLNGTNTYTWTTANACDPSFGGVYADSLGNTGFIATSPPQGTLDVEDTGITDEFIYTPGTTFKTTGTETLTFYITLDSGFTYTPNTVTFVTSQPTVSSVSPTSGPTTGGTSVTITGTNFFSSSTVKFGSASASSVTVNSSTSITATAPAGSGTVDITVTTPGGTSATSAADQFTYTTAQPTVTSVSPSSGFTAGGTSVTVTGTNFTGATAVKFGSTNASSYTVNSATSITATSPPGSAGTVDITVTTSNGTSATSGSDQFTYVAPPVANAVSATVAYGSTNNNITLNIAGGSPTSVAVSTAASHGTATASGTSITYTPNASYSGPDSFTYTATNGAGTSSPATVTITVSAATITYAPSSPAGGTVGTAYSQSIASAGGGTSPYTYSLASGALPAGITLASNGTLSGTPTAGGSFNFTVTATDSSTGTGPFSATSGTLTLTIASPTISVSPTTLSAATVGVAYSTTISAGGGTSPYTYALSSGSLPVGMTLASNGNLSGTPTASGTFNFTVTAMDSSTGTGSPYTGSRAYSLIVSAPTISLSPTTLSNPTVGAAYSQTVSASGGGAPYIYAVTAGSLPTGLSLNASTGVISGTPTAGGTFSFTISATDANSFTGSRAYSVTASAPTISISPTTLSVATAGSAYSTTISASGGTSSYTFAITSGALPAGLSLSSSGVLSGTPTASGTFNFTVTATDSSTVTDPYTGSRAYSLIVNSPTLSISPTSGTSLTGNAGSSYSQTFSASGGTSPYTYALTVNSGTMPTGLSFSTGTGVLSGTPTSAGTVNFTVTGTDSSTGAGPYTVAGTYALTISAPTISLSPTTLPNPTVGAVYSQTVSASGGTAAYTYAVTAGSLPTGLSLNASTGVISGTPTASGAFNFTISATDAHSFTGSRAYSVTVAAPTITVTPASLPRGQSATAYSQTVSASGGISPYTFAVSAGALPTGLSLNSTTGVISGTPSSAGTYNVTIQATDSSTGTGAPFTASQAYSVVINPQTPIAGALNVTVAFNTPKAIDLSSVITGGVASSVTVATAPSHGSTSVSGTTVTYTPATGYTGADSFTYTATNAGGTSAPATVTLQVNPPAPVLAPISVSTVSGAPVTLNVAAHASGGPFTGLNIVSQPANGSAVVQGFTLVYTSPPTFVGTASIVYALSNAYGTTQGTATITVNARLDPTKDPEVNGLLSAQAEATRRFANAQLSNFHRRLESLHGSGWGSSSFGLNISSFGVEPNTKIAADQGWAGQEHLLAANEMRRFALPRSKMFNASDRQQDGGGAALSIPERNALGIWVGGGIDFGHRDAASGQERFRFHTDGVSIGGDYRVDELWSVGLGVGFSRDVSDVGSNGSKSKATAGTVVAYGTLRPTETLFVDGILGYSMLNFDLDRFITDTGGFATGSRRGRQIFGSLSSGVEYKNEVWLLSPYGRLDVMTARLDPYTETAAGVSALSYGEQTVRMTTGNIGLRGETRYDLIFGRLVPRIRVEFQHRFEGADDANMSYSDLGAIGPVYTTHLNPVQRNLWVMDVGGMLIMRSGLTISLDYGGSLNNDTGYSQSIRFLLEKQF